MWPQYTYLALTVLGIGFTIAKHGDPRTGEHNIVSHLIVVALSFGLMYAGGFFKGIF